MCTRQSTASGKRCARARRVGWREEGRKPRLRRGHAWSAVAWVGKDAGSLRSRGYQSRSNASHKKGQMRVVSPVVQGLFCGEASHEAASIRAVAWVLFLVRDHVLRPALDDARPRPNADALPGWVIELTVLNTYPSVLHIAHMPIWEHTQTASRSWDIFIEFIMVNTKHRMNSSPLHRPASSLVVRESPGIMPCP